MNKLNIKDFFIGDNQPLTIIAGPCVIEDEAHALFLAESLTKIVRKHPISFIFKASYDKANRSSFHSFRGPGIDEGLRILEKIKKTFDIPVVTDVHSPEEAKAAACVCDMIQIPAFLCRQTDLVVAAAETGAAINVKKGQFLSPSDMSNIVDKILSSHNKRILLTERGVSFGYNNLVTDFRAIPIMKKTGFPVCFDATHSVQLPGGLKDRSGGEREFVPMLSKAAIASGANALFIECHDDPSRAKSDAATVLPLDMLSTLLDDVDRVYEAIWHLPEFSKQ